MAIYDSLYATMNLQLKQSVAASGGDGHRAEAPVEVASAFAEDLLARRYQAAAFSHGQAHLAPRAARRRCWLVAAQCRVDGSLLQRLATVPAAVRQNAPR